MHFYLSNINFSEFWTQLDNFNKEAKFKAPLTRMHVFDVKTFFKA